jgi:hypothetical protein
MIHADQGRLKRSFSSAVAPSTHQAPTRSRPINWARAWALGAVIVSGAATFHCASCKLGNQVLPDASFSSGASDCVCRKNRAGRHAQGERDVAAERDPN